MPPSTRILSCTATYLKSGPLKSCIFVSHHCNWQPLLSTKIIYLKMFLGLSISESGFFWSSLCVHKTVKTTHMQIHKFEQIRRRLSKRLELLTNWFLQNNGDDTKYVYKYLITVPLQVQTIIVRSKPFQSESVFKSVFYWRARFYEHRVIFTVDGQ